MRILLYIFKAVLGSVISKIVTMCLLFGGSLYLAHATGRLAPVLQMVGIETDGTFQGAVASISNAADDAGVFDSVKQAVGFGDAPLSVAAATPAAASSAQFLKVAARISDVSRECRLLDLRGSRVTRTQPMPCHKAEEMVRRAEFAGFELRRFAKVDYIYYAPDGTTVLKGNFSPKSSDSRTFQVGSVIDIRVDPTSPERSEPI